MNVPVPGPTAAGEDETPGAARADSAPERLARAPVTRKTLDEVFGDVLPTVTRDELDDRVGDAGRAAERDRWYEDNRPPHHT